MKKLIALTAILSLSAAFAEDVVYGTYVLNSSQEEVILGVPWINPGSDNGAIPVTDLIQKSTLVNGDQIYYYDLSAQKYVVWELNNGDWVKDAKSEGTPSDLVRGNAIILKRPGVATRENKQIIINGQVGTTAVGAMTMAKAQGNKWAYTLLAPPSAEAKKLSDAIWGGKIGKNDMIVIGNKLPYKYNTTDSKWGQKSYDDNLNPVWTDVDPVIPAGQGAWYISTGDDSEPTCTWSANPTASSAD